jgi:hypothetical protein
VFRKLLVDESDSGSIVDSCVLRLLGGVLQNSVDKLLSFDEMHDVLVSVESAPMFLSGLSELEHHGQASASRATALGAARNAAGSDWSV